MTIPFEKLERGNTYWVAPKGKKEANAHVMVGPLEGSSRRFSCLNGGWSGTLTHLPDDSIELLVHKTGSRHIVDILELAGSPISPEEFDDIAF